MSKLDDVFQKLLFSYQMPFTPEYEKGKEVAKQQIKDLVLELIGEAPAYSQPGMYEINVENKLRARLRQKVNEL